MCRRSLGKRTQALIRDTNQPRNGATAVATEEVARPHRVIDPGIVVLDPRGDTVAVLLQLGQFMVEPNRARIELFGTRLHDRLEANLRKIGAAAGTGLHPVEIGVSAAPGLDLADLAAEFRVGTGKTG